MAQKPIIENGIKSYFHCRTCLEKGDRDIIAVGWTYKGLQVWCDNCDTNLIALDFMGNDIKTDNKPNEK
jgi:hypothetical protein